MKLSILRPIALIALVALVLLTGCTRPEPVTEPPVEIIPTASEQQVSLRTTVMYYQDDNGYLIPVMRSLPWQDGIAKATLEGMVSGGQNDLEAARLGLKTVLPEGTKIDLNIASKTATLNLAKQALTARDAAEESIMVSAIVSTLTEFPTVDKVQIKLDGKAADALKYGTDISKPISRGNINLESLPVGVTMGGAKKVQLYFQSDSSSAMVPITRMVFGNADVNTAVLELIKGPKKDSGLNATLPPKTALLNVTQKNGIVTINFTKEFMTVADSSDGGQQAMKALALTCAQFPGVKEVKVQVEGKAFDPGSATLAIPTFVNTESDSWGADFDTLPVTSDVRGS